MSKAVEIKMEALKKRLIRMRKNLNNGSPIMRKTAILMDKDVIDHFEKEKGPRSRWASTARGGKKLQDKGRLRLSIRPRSTKDQAIVGTNMVYAATHNYGDSSRNIKKRKFLWLSREIKEKIKKNMGQYFIGDKVV